jgi:hypothetical protein
LGVECAILGIILVMGNVESAVFLVRNVIMIELVRSALLDLLLMVMEGVSRVVRIAFCVEGLDVFFVLWGILIVIRDVNLVQKIAVRARMKTIVIFAMKGSIQTTENANHAHLNVITVKIALFAKNANQVHIY